MTKKMVKGLLVIALVAIFATPVLADGTNGSWNDGSDVTGAAITDSNGGGAGISSDDLKFSSGVWYNYQADTTTTDGGTYFGLGTWNSKGTKAYGTNSEASKLFVSKSDFTTSGNLPSPAASGTTWTNWQEVGK